MAKSFWERSDEYAKKVSGEIIDQIKRGVASWQKPWKPGEQQSPENFSTGKKYSGGNSLYLMSRAERDGRGDNRWGTYNQIREAGGQVRKGEKGTQVLFFTDKNSRAAKDEEGKTMKNKEGKTVYEEQKREKPVCKQYTVFNVEQAEGLELKPQQAQVRPEWDAHRDAEKVIAANGADVQHVAGDRAYYRMSEDKIVLPEQSQFPTRNGYYQTALHECGHATGHPDRMDRQSLKDGLEKGFGSPEYAREELRAEISAMMTGERVGVGHDPKRGAAYVENWVKALEKDPYEIQRAARDAQKMTNHLMDRAVTREVANPTKEKSRVELTQEYSPTHNQEMKQHVSHDLHGNDIRTSLPKIDIPPPSKPVQRGAGMQRAQEAEDREQEAAIERVRGPQDPNRPPLEFKHGPPKEVPHSPQIKERRAEQAEDGHKFAAIERHHGPQRTDQPASKSPDQSPDQAKQKQPDMGPSR